MNKILIKNARIVNEGRMFKGSVLIDGDKIAEVFEEVVPETASMYKLSMLKESSCYREQSTIRYISVNRA